MSATNTVLLAAAGGLAVGFVLASVLVNPSDCCVRVAAGVREEVGDQLGAGAVAVGDALHLWGYTPGLLALFGVDP